MKKLLFLLLIIIPILSRLPAEAQWVQVSNGMGNTVTVSSLAYSGNTIFAGTYNIGYGVWLSTDNGTNWTRTSLNRWVLSLAANGNNVFAGTTDYSGVYSSTDSGTSWIQTLLGPRGVFSLALNGNNVFAGTNYGLYLSTNNGTSWTGISLGGSKVFSLAVNGNNVFAGTGDPGNGVYISTNNGTSWTQTSLNSVSVVSLAVNGNYVFAGSGGYGVYLSTNNGTTWAQTSLINQYVNALAVNGNSVFAGNWYPNGVYVSNNNGTSWTQRNEGLSNLTVRALCILNNYIFAGIAGNSVYRRPLSELVGIHPISEQLPEHFALYQNFPNPFNPTTKIKFDVPANLTLSGAKGLIVKLTIFDLLGRELATLINEPLNPGTYEAEWDASNYPSGVYYYRLTASSFSESRTMILLK